jgi:hypothetical protein
MGLDAMPREMLVGLTAFAVVALGMVLSFARRGLRRWRLRVRWERGAAGEREARGLLEAAGFFVEATQATSTYALDVDGVPMPVVVRADYLVSKGRERFVAEVKTGKAAPRLETIATRRQLLEYQHAFGAAAVLLVDADLRRIRAVRFEAPSAADRGKWGEAPTSSAIVWVLAATAVAGLAFALSRS